MMLYTSILQTIIPSRQNSPAVHIALIVIACIVLIIIVKQTYSTVLERLREATNNSSRKKLDVKALRSQCIKLGFTKADIDFFETQCKKNDITFVPLIANTEYCIQTVFKRIYTTICENADKLSLHELENLKLHLFMLIYKLEDAKRSLSLLTSTSAFTEGHQISYLSVNGTHHKSKIIENNKTGLFIEVAIGQNGKPVQPPALSKIVLYFELHGGIAYQVITRIMRYQSRNGVEEMVVIHSNDVQFFQRRKFRRLTVSLDCSFTATRIVENPLTGKKNYIANDKKYSGTIVNISASGCRLNTNLPIRADQDMQITVKLPHQYEGVMVGHIVRSRREANKSVCVLNIRFIRMLKRTQNNIFSLVYNFDSETNTENQTQ